MINEAGEFGDQLGLAICFCLLQDAFDMRPHGFNRNIPVSGNRADGFSQEYEIGDDAFRWGEVKDLLDKILVQKKRLIDPFAHQEGMSCLWSGQGESRLGENATQPFFLPLGGCQRESTTDNAHMRANGAPQGFAI